MIKTTYDSEPISTRQLVPSVEGYTQKMGRKALQGVIKNHVGVLAISIAAIRAFIQGEMPDPLVGENACQIRAVYYCAQAADKKKMAALSEVCPQLEDLIQRISKVKLPEKDQMVSWGELMKEHDLDLKLPACIAPIVFGHILTVAKQSQLLIQGKVVSLDEKNDPKRLKGVSNGNARELIKHARRSLSAWSVRYLQDEADRWNIQGPGNVLTDEMGLVTAPAMPGIKILLASIKAYGIMIVLKNWIVDEEGKKTGEVILRYRPDGTQRSYQIASHVEDEGQMAMIIEAVSISSRTPEELEGEMVKQGIESILYGNFAAHPQYGGGCKMIEPDSYEEREKWREIAVQKGLCAANPDVCLMYHIYAGRVGGAA